MTQRNWLGLRHLALNVQDVKASTAFYVDLLGFHVEWMPDPDNVYLTTGEDNLALHKAAGELKPGALDHLGFVVTDPAQVDVWRRRVGDYGATIAKDIRTHRDGARSFYFTDPDGNLIQLMYHPPLADLPASEDPRLETTTD